MNELPGWLILVGSGVVTWFVCLALAKLNFWAESSYGCSLYRLIVGPEDLSKQLDEELGRFRESFPSAEIYLKVWLPGLNRYVSAVVFVKRGRTGFVDFYEVVEKTRPQDFHRKAQELREWEGASSFLSSFLRMDVPCFGVLGTPTLDIFLGK